MHSKKQQIAMNKTFPIFRLKEVLATLKAISAMTFLKTDSFYSCKAASRNVKAIISRIKESQR